VFVIRRHTRVDDALHIKPDLARFTCTPRVPVEPLRFVTVPSHDLPL
jgi:hypothetical protein